MTWFDIKSFLKASRHWDEDLKKLNEELSDLPYLPAVDNKTGVRRSDISDTVAQIAHRRLKIQDRIDEILLDKEMLDYAFKTLTEDERSLIDGIFYPKKKIGVFVQEYGHEHGLSERSVHYAKDRILNRMKDAIIRKYYKD